MVGRTATIVFMRMACKAAVSAASATSYIKTNELGRCLKLAVWYYFLMMMM